MTPAEPRRRRRASGSTHPWAFVVPAFVALAVFFLTPTLYNFVYAFTDWSSFKSSIRLTGWSNFAQLVSSGDLRRALVITLLYAGGVAVAQNLFGLGLALLLERDTVVNKVVRVVFFIPVVMSALGSTRWTLLVVVLIHAWKWMGMSMLVYLAGLKTIDHQVLEAARIDGASRWQTLVRIRMPLIAPAVIFNVATALLGSMNSFDIVQATTGGGPGGSTELLNLYIFRTFGQGLYAQATTMSLVLFLAVVLLAFPVIGMLRRRERNMA